MGCRKRWIWKKIYVWYIELFPSKVFISFMIYRLVFLWCVPWCVLSLRRRYFNACAIGLMSRNYATQVGTAAPPTLENLQKTAIIRQKIALKSCKIKGKIFVHNGFFYRAASLNSTSPYTNVHSGTSNYDYGSPALANGKTLSFWKLKWLPSTQEATWPQSEKLN